MINSLSNKELSIFTQAIDEYYCEPYESKETEPSKENCLFDDCSLKGFDVSSNSFLKDKDAGNEDSDLGPNVNQCLARSYQNLNLEINNEEGIKLTFFLVNDWFKRILLTKSINLISSVCNSPQSTLNFSGRILTKKLIFEQGDCA